MSAMKALLSSPGYADLRARLRKTALGEEDPGPTQNDGRPLEPRRMRSFSPGADRRIRQAPGFASTWKILQNQLRGGLDSGKQVTLTCIRATLFVDTCACCCRCVALRDRDQIDAG